MQQAGKDTLYFFTTGEPLYIDITAISGKDPQKWRFSKAFFDLEQYQQQQLVCSVQEKLTALTASKVSP